MKLSSTVATSVLAVLAAFSLSGCLALAIPSLAYQGYKYEKDQEQGQQTQNAKQNKSSADNATDYDTE